MKKSEMLEYEGCRILAESILQEAKEIREDGNPEEQLTAKLLEQTALKRIAYYEGKLEEKDSHSYTSAPIDTSHIIRVSSSLGASDDIERYWVRHS